jgi:hypothetical protein
MSANNSASGAGCGSASNSHCNGGYSSSPSKKSHHQHQQNSNGGLLDFASLLKKWGAPIPPALSRKLGRTSDSPLGKVRLRIFSLVMLIYFIRPLRDSDCNPYFRNIS